MAAAARMQAVHGSLSSVPSAVKSAKHILLDQAASCSNILHTPRQRHRQQPFSNWSSEIKCPQNQKPVRLESPPGSFCGGNLSSIVGHGRKKGQLRRRKGVRLFATSGSLLQEATLNGHEKNERQRRQPRMFKGLKASEFQHPLDRQNTAILRAFPGIQEIAKMLFSPVAEQVLLLENIATSVHVGEHQLTRIHNLLTEAGDILDMDAPDLYIRQNPTPNAYTLAIAGRKPFIVIHTSLVELLTPAELQAVLAHEMGHLKCDHGVWLTFANILAMSAGSLPGLGRLIASNLEDQLMRWLRAAELTCDRAALLVAQDPKVVVSVLMKLAGGCPSLADDLNVDSFLKQARSYDEASSSPFGWYLRNAQTRQLSHPLPVLRAREIDEWSRGKQYQLLMGAPSANRSNSERPVVVQR